MKQASSWLQRSVAQFGATVSKVDDHVEINWLVSENARLDQWFCAEVLTHELGHHFVEQYKTKRGGNRKSIHHEIVADIHSQRLCDGLLKS